MDMFPTMSNPAWPTRLFTVESANALLPVVIPILERMQTDQHLLDETGDRLDSFTEAMRSNGHAMEALRLEQQALRLRRQIEQDIIQIALLGVELKNIATGLIDFPALRHNEIVLLCWKLGEGDIAYWHDLQSGFAGRRPLDFGNDSA
jgi:hypothetical protein